MKALIDTNVLVDALSSREPFFQDSYDVIALCANNRAQGFVAAHSIPDLFYILRSKLSAAQRRQTLLSLCKILTVVGIDEEKITASLRDENFSDFEDSLQHECAKSIGADCIVTRDAKDFAASSARVMAPQDFLRLFRE